jgi:hypothetical protein
MEGGRVERERGRGSAGKMSVRTRKTTTIVCRKRKKKSSNPKLKP